MFDAYSLGKKLKHYRNKNNLSQKALADKVNMKQNTISGLENGKINSFSIYKLSKIAEILNITLDDLLCDSINKFSLDNNTIIKNSVYEIKLKDLLSTLNDYQLLVFSEYFDDFLNYKNIEFVKNNP